MNLGNKVLWGVFVVAFAATMVYAYTFTLVSSDAVASCTDSDGGLDARVAGNVSGKKLNSTSAYLDFDTCITNTTLHEKACGSVPTRQTWSTNCNNMTENTTLCSSGRCV